MTMSPEAITADRPEGKEGTKDSGFCRREKRKLAKKLKRKQIRKEIALKEREEEEARLNDEEDQRKLMLKEKEEAEMMEKERKEFEERERLWMERLAAKKAQEEEEQAKKKLLEEESLRNQDENDGELKEDDDWEYVEEGPAEIIWQGNEIIVKKKKVKVPKKDSNQQGSIEDAARPTSNPLPPQSEVYASYRNTSVSSQQVFESVSQQNPNFGTEQDKAHCPFHIKTGACRFGSRCSRTHFYPDKSCTLLMKNMYTGPGLAWEQDEGLELRYLPLVAITPKVLNWQCTDEEIDRSYEEFYEDVHTEFLKFGEIINFKVCKNGSFHLRGNVYVHYKSLESAVLAYDSINGRYFAGKQITCEYVGVTRWKVAICGEYMKSRLKTCSRGTACNFIHCFRNPGGDYEWADWDNPPPRYWMKKMAALFGPSDEVEYDKHTEKESVGFSRNSKKTLGRRERYHERESRSKDCDSLPSSSDGDDSDGRRECSRKKRRSTSSGTKKYSARSRKVRGSTDDRERCEEDPNFEDDRYGGKSIPHGNGPGDYYSKDTDRHYSHSRANSHRKRREHSDSRETVRKEYNSNEQYEEKDRLCRRDSNKKYDDLSTRRKSHSSRWEHVSGQVKTENIHDEPIESQNSGYESPRAHVRRWESRSPTSGPYFSETVDPSDRWETGSSFPDESKNTMSCSFDDNEQCKGRHYSLRKSSAGHHNNIRSISRQEERDSSSEDLNSREDCEHYDGKHVSFSGHKKNKTPQNAEKCFSSGESREESDVEEKKNCVILKHNSGDHQLRKSGHLQNDYSKRSRHRTKRKHESIEKDETVPTELEGASRKRSRSRLPDHHRCRSSKERVCG